MVSPVVSGKFTVVRNGIEYDFESADEGGYVVSVPRYPSCVTQGETFEEALANIEDALRESLAAAKDLGLEVPPDLAQSVER